MNFLNPKTFLNLKESVKIFLKKVLGPREYFWKGESDFFGSCQTFWNGWIYKWNKFNWFYFLFHFTFLKQFTSCIFVFHFTFTKIIYKRTFMFQKIIIENPFSFLFFISKYLVVNVFLFSWHFGFHPQSMKHSTNDERSFVPISDWSFLLFILVLAFLLFHFHF